jgi:hypothetical protein
MPVRGIDDGPVRHVAAPVAALRRAMKDRR